MRGLERKQSVVDDDIHQQRRRFHARIRAREHFECLLWRNLDKKLLSQTFFLDQYLFEIVARSLIILFHKVA